MKAKIILLADNLQDFLEARREFLEQAGYTVITADNPADTRKILERGKVDLAILDIRLVDDNDERDTSGLELAREFGQHVPIIILTGYPTWNAVKVALGRDLNGLSSAVDFLSKEEDPDLMVRSVNMTIEHPRLKRNILQEFKVEASQALYDDLRRKEIAETTDKFQKSLDRTECELQQRRKEISQQSESHQNVAKWMGLVGMGVLVVGAFLVFFKMVPVAVFSGVIGVVSELISVLFIARANQASRQVEKIYLELQEIYKASHLILICDTIEAKSKREKAKMLIIEKLTGKWLG
jgi:DNA-binding response OmpR family regulator